MDPRTGEIFTLTDEVKIVTNSTWTHGPEGYQYELYWKKVQMERCGWKITGAEYAKKYLDPDYESSAD